MPRRIPDYPDAFAGWNFVSSIGSLISTIALGIFFYMVYDLFTKQQTRQESYVGNDYWLHTYCSFNAFYSFKNFVYKF